MANAIIQLYENKIHDVVNFGTGEEVSIKDMIEMVIKISQKDITINWDTTKPNGDLKRLMDVTKQKKYNLLPEIPLLESIKKVYEYYSNKK